MEKWGRGVAVVVVCRSLVLSCSFVFPRFLFFRYTARFSRARVLAEQFASVTSDPIRKRRWKNRGEPGRHELGTAICATERIFRRWRVRKRSRFFLAETLMYIIFKLDFAAAFALDRKSASIDKNTVCQRSFAYFTVDLVRQNYRLLRLLVEQLESKCTTANNFEINANQDSACNTLHNYNIILTTLMTVKTTSNVTPIDHRQNLSTRVKKDRVNLTSAIKPLAR